jgi:hypothetical protein
MGLGFFGGAKPSIPTTTNYAAIGDIPTPWDMRESLVMMLHIVSSCALCH